MSHKISRREAGKMLAIAPLTLSLSAPAAAPRKIRVSSPPSTLSARQRRDLAKVEESYEKAAASVRKMRIPIGTEPAFAFRPLRVKQ